jgi:hypothetical protein
MNKDYTNPYHSPISVISVISVTLWQIILSWMSRYVRNCPQPVRNAERTHCGVRWAYPLELQEVTSQATSAFLSKGGD